MNREKIKKTAFAVLFALANLAAFGGLLTKGPIMSGQSLYYIKNDFLLAPGYPVVLDVFWKVFGSSYLDRVVAFQALAVIGAGLFLSLALTRAFRLGRISFTLVYLALVFPAVQPFFMYGRSHFAPLTIMPWALGCALMYLGAGAILRYVFQPGTKNLALVLGPFIGLCFLEFRYLAVYLSLACLLAYGYWATKNRRQLAWGMVLLVGFVLGWGLLERGYNLATRGKFAASPGIGVSALAPQLYLAEDADADLFEDPAQKQWFAMLRSAMKEQGLDRRSHPKKPLQSPVYHYFHEAHGKIRFQVIPATFLTLRGGSPPGPAGIPEDALVDGEKLALDKTARHMAAKLFFSKLARLPGFFLHQVLEGHGRNQYFLVLLFAPLFFFAYLALATKDPRFMALLFLAALKPVNDLSVFLFEPLKARHMFPAINITCACLVIFLAMFLHLKKQGEKGA